MNILIINGPNLNILGNRQNDLYGELTLDQINSSVIQHVNNRYIDLKSQIKINFIQSNIEGELINLIQCATDYDFIIINPAAYTHTSIAMRDALIAINVPFIELHLSNVYQREDFRHKSYFSDVAIGVICGLGGYGYVMAVDYAIKYLIERK